MPGTITLMLKMTAASVVISSSEERPNWKGAGMLIAALLRAYSAGPHRWRRERAGLAVHVERLGGGGEHMAEQVCRMPMITIRPLPGLPRRRPYDGPYAGSVTATGRMNAEAFRLS